MVFLLGSDAAFSGLILGTARHAFEKHGIQSVLLRNPEACSQWTLKCRYLLVADHREAAWLANSPVPWVVLVDGSGFVNAEKALMGQHAEAWPLFIDKWVLDPAHFRRSDSLLQFTSGAPTFVTKDLHGRVWSSSHLGLAKRAVVWADDGCANCVGALETVAAIDSSLRARILVLVHPEGGPGSKEYAQRLSDQGWDVVLDAELCLLFDRSVLPSGVSSDADGHLSLATQRGDRTFTEWLLDAVT